MKKIILAAGALAISAVSASAADMAVKAPPIAPVVAYNWTGCYIGGNVGGAWHRIEQSGLRTTGATAPVVDFIPPLDIGSANSNGDFIGGGQIGCDYQFAGRWVVGVQGMFDFGHTSSSNVAPDPRLVAAIAPFQTTRTRDLFTGTARIGYLFTPAVLGYVKGGGAWTNSFTAITGTIPTPFLSESASADRSGWTVGGGIEWMFAKGWSVFGEYNYMDFGRKDITFTPGPGTVGDATIISTRLTMQTALVGVNYKFNFAGPVVAKQ
jgi:outer membrane immunogenic protein